MCIDLETSKIKQTSVQRNISALKQFRDIIMKVVLYNNIRTKSNPKRHDNKGPELIENNGQIK